MEGPDKGFTIKELPVEERPREKVLKKGSSYLSNAELLALIIRTGNRNRTAVELSQDLLNYFGGLRGILDLSSEELQEVKGIGIAKSAQIIAVIELAKRIASIKNYKKDLVSNPAQAAELLTSEMRFLKQEVLRTILLDVKNRVIAVPEISKGGLSSSIVHPREVFKEAIRRSSAAVILVHNHPSGDPKPSADDINITKKLQKAGEIIGIKVIDHIIIAGDKFLSFKEENLIK
ncbi:DNA repair protein RadC [Halanaerobium sp. Z-7514]|uniref:DNA repair protein RadC n=1 Tax=Halanaerobium polyolivorans TaxID=2886943 RepID=A0AAW4WT08_9FIRM|nr:DNA repair protein RadC [Halanaerobium polyolivorans]MCC3144222.1 DNA repair protein RadC [Halanaerobium polyolivorans]RQD75784.1 MAG: JAB domain-containing protein [Halanaerobium sp. MSAO_Bac5]